MTADAGFGRLGALLSLVDLVLPMTPPHTEPDRLPLFWRALIDVPRVGADDWRSVSAATRWLLACRAALLPLTGFAALFALAIARDPIDPAIAGLTVLGLLLAHATNNLINDHVDARMGLDADNYFRTRYGTQPLAAGWMSVRQHRAMTLWTGAAAAICGTGVVVLSDGSVLTPMLIGAVFVLFYTWPMKHVGLGELAVWIVWGPLMVGATVLAVAGRVGTEHWLLGALYGLGPLVVILGKHTDKRDDDLARGVRTLPALVPEAAARALLGGSAITLPLGCVCWASISGQWSYLIALLAVPSLIALLRRAARPRPGAPPEGAIGWPLWFAGAGFVFARHACALLLLAALIERYLS